MGTNEYLIGKLLAVPWETASANDSIHSWINLSQFINGVQTTLTFTHSDDDEMIADLQFLWTLAIQRSLMLE